jgi:hypothetical protein
MSTLRVDKISPYQSSSILIEGDVIQANAATTGSNTFIGNQIVSASNSVTTFGGNFIDLYVDAGNFDTFKVEVADGSGVKFTDWDGANTASFLEVGTNSGDITILRDTTVSGNLNIVGNLTATQYVVSSSVSHITTSFSSGSTIFGDTLDDTHLFTGSVDVTGSVTATSFSGSLSYTDLTDVPTLVSGSSQVIDLLPAGTVSGSSQVIDLLPAGTVSGSTQVIDLLPAGTVSGSSQITYGDISSIPSGIISSSAQIDLLFDIDGLVSGSSQVISLLPNGTVSGSSQVAELLPNGTVSGSTQVIDLLPAGTVSGSSQVIDLLPAGAVSGSSQISYLGLSNIPNGIISSSAQIDLLFDIDGLVSSSNQVIELLPNGTVSGSSQVLNYNIFTTTSSFNEFTSSHNSGSFSGSFVGEVVLNASAGIDFSANTSGPGSTSKVLDWYEEGTFDYTVSGSVSGYWTPRSGYESIAYTKIGRHVTITGQIEIDASSTPDGDAIFTLPYTASNGFEFRTSAAVSLRGENPTTSGTVHAYVEDGQAAFKLMAVETGSSFTLGDTHLDSAWEFMVGLTYFTNS